MTKQDNWETPPANDNEAEEWLREGGTPEKGEQLVQYYRELRGNAPEANMMDVLFAVLVRFALGDDFDVRGG